MSIAAGWRLRRSTWDCRRGPGGSRRWATSATGQAFRCRPLKRPGRCWKRLAGGPPGQNHRPIARRRPAPGWPARDGVSWSNHLQTKSNEIRLTRQKEFEKGDPPTTQLTKAWRERAEDMVWTLINCPEFVWIP